MIRKVLIANRGEIACRIARTCRSLGLGAATVHSAADATARHVREIGESVLLGGAQAAESYLRIDRVVAAAKSVGADAIHPGYGFLAENPAFCRAVEEAGLCFIGPSAEALERFGDKAKAKRAAVEAGLPIVPGSEAALDDPDAIARAAAAVGFPLLLKAVAGGGGRGQRVVHDRAGLADGVQAALREAVSAFGHSGLILERLIEGARHVEVQIAGDGGGEVIHLYERDCSLQRRRQKVIEEAPAPGLARGVAERMRADAVRLCASVGYRGLGTVEFLVRGGEHWFLEVNPRLQVEHPVTEAVTGLDLVALQLRIAAGEGLGIAQRDVQVRGHAVEARIYAEDAASGFAPSTGTIRGLALPEDLARVDAGVEDGDEITPYYDPMIAKVIVAGRDRGAALAALGSALEATAVGGVTANVGLLRALVRRPEVGCVEVHTGLIDQKLDELTRIENEPDAALRAGIAALLWLLSGRGREGEGTWRSASLIGWRLGTGTPPAVSAAGLRLQSEGREWRVAVASGDRSGAFLVAVDRNPAEQIRLLGWEEGACLLDLAGRALRIRSVVTGATIVLGGALGAAVFEATSHLAAAASSQEVDGTVSSPLMGLIVKVVVAEEQAVRAGETIAVLESMKMQMPVKAPRDGSVAKLACREGQMVERGQILAEIRPA